MAKLRRSGGYRMLASFQTATLIYDATVAFCDRFVDPRSRTVDQMVQAARSGRQNIAEGSRAAAVSSQSELRLVNVARASMEELLLDYEDYLRHRGLERWGMDDPEAKAVREIPKSLRCEVTDQSGSADLLDQRRWKLYERWLAADDASIRANALICVIHQVNYLLDRQLVELEQRFIHEGGYSEQLAAARVEQRRKNRSDVGQTDRRRSDRTNKNLTDPSDRTDRTVDPIPDCPRCGDVMVLRTARQGHNAGQSFWGCSGYPDCKGKRPV